MPDPDPQPPQPRPVSTARWLLMLTPSVLVLSTLMILERMEGADNGMRLEMISFVVLALAVMLCFALGFLVEKWRRGKINSFVWALDYGFLILVVNGFIFVAAMEALGFSELR